MNGPLVEGITVSGTGEAEVEPDTGYIDLGIQVIASTVSEARALAAAAANAVLASVQSNGVAAADVRTSGYSVQPQYNYPPSGNPELRGYQVTNNVTVRGRDLARFSAILDGAADAGGDATRVNGVRFGRDDDGEARSAARAAAMADAHAKAAELAAAARLGLGGAVAIEEVAGGWSPFPQEGMMKAARDTATPIEPGMSTVSVTVTVRYAIEA